MFCWDPVIPKFSETVFWMSRAPKNLGKIQLQTDTPWKSKIKLKNGFIRMIPCKGFLPTTIGQSLVFGLAWAQFSLLGMNMCLDLGPGGSSAEHVVFL